MWTDHDIIFTDLDKIITDPIIPWDSLDGKNFYITGATGFLGGMLCRSLLYAAEIKKIKISIVAQIRSKNKSTDLFKIKDSLKYGNLDFQLSDITNVISIKDNLDYIIHCASPTSSAYFVNNPVETINSIFNGTQNILNLSLEKNVTSVLYLSSMEVYGTKTKEIVEEEDIGYLPINSVRSSYPQAKRLAETLCYSYYHKYNLPVKIVRPTLTFGPGVLKTDNRIFMQMGRSVINNKDIILFTNGLSKRDYIYTSDISRLLLSILLLGTNGETYNVSNPDTYMSIVDLAKHFQKFAKNTDIIFDKNTTSSQYYPSETHIQLDITKMMQLNNFKLTPIDTMIMNLLDWIRLID